MMIPVAVWDAVPSSRYTLKPSTTKLHCFRGDLGAGSLGNLTDTAVSKIAVTFPFENMEQMVKYDRTGKFQVYDGISPL